MAWIKFGGKKPKPSSIVAILAYNHRDHSVFYDIVPARSIAKDGKVITTRYSSNFPMEVAYYMVLPFPPESFDHCKTIPKEYRE